VPELDRLARTVARWETPILRWHRTRLTNAATEGTNLVIKNIKRLGFHWQDNYLRFSEAREAVDRERRLFRLKVAPMRTPPGVTRSSSGDSDRTGEAERLAEQNE
jgi:hypothetical protein